MLDVLVRSTLFGVRNADKVATTTDKGRVAADVGQFTKAARTAAMLDNALGKGAQAAISVVGKASENSKILDYAAKGAKLASNHVNPLLIGAAGYRVMIADDKKSQIGKEVFGMSSMFAVEGMMKEGFNSKFMNEVRANMKNKYAKTALAILEGVLFVGGSIAGSAVGYKIGEKIYDNGKAPKIAVEDKKSVDEYEKEFNKPINEKQVLA